MKLAKVTAKKVAEELDLPLEALSERVGRELKERSLISDQEMEQLRVASEINGTAPQEPKVRRTRKAPKQEIDPVANELMEYLGQFRSSDSFEIFPEDLTKKRPYCFGTTVDGKRLRVSLVQYNSDMSRGGFGIPLFSESVSNQLVTLMSRLKDAPDEHATGPIGERLFMNHTAWYYHMLGIAEKIWAEELNPPGLDLERFPKRAKVDKTVTWRFRDPSFGFVTRAFEAFIEDAGNLKGSDRRRFERQWIDEFTSGARTFELGGVAKSMIDFTVGRRPGTKPQFEQMWDIVTDPRKRQ